MVDAEAEQLRESLPADTRLVVVADHGMVDSPAGSRVDVDEHLELRDGVALLGGEARFRHLYCRRGAVADVLATWRGFLGDRAEVLSRDEAVARGWFGAAAPAMLPRIGDVVVASRGDRGVFSSRRLRLRDHAGRPARVADARRDADPDPGQLTRRRFRAAQPNGSGSGARETAFARAAVSRRRWCWRQSTS